MASRNASPLRHPSVDQLDFATVLEALRDPARLGIVAALATSSPMHCSRFELPMAKSAASRHFRLLRDAGVIRQWDEGTRRLNELRRDDLDRRFPGLLDLAIAEGAVRRVDVLPK